VTPLVRHPVVSVRHNRVLTLGQHKVLAWTRGLSLAAVAWGALAFGGVYPWAYWPLALVCAVAGVLGLSATTAASPAVPRTLSISLALLGTAVLLQLVPLPLPALSFISPAASATLHAYSPSFAAGLDYRHALSIQPAATWTALALFVAFVLLLLGITRALSITGARRLVEGITILGVVLALGAGLILYYGYQKDKMGVLPEHQAAGGTAEALAEVTQPPIHGGP